MKTRILRRVMFLTPALVIGYGIVVALVNYYVAATLLVLGAVALAVVLFHRVKAVRAVMQGPIGLVAAAGLAMGFLLLLTLLTTNFMMYVIVYGPIHLAGNSKITLTQSLSDKERFDVVEEIPIEGPPLVLHQIRSPSKDAIITLIGKEGVPVALPVDVQGKTVYTLVVTRQITAERKGFLAQEAVVRPSRLIYTYSKPRDGVTNATSKLCAFRSGPP